VPFWRIFQHKLKGGQIFTIIAFFIIYLFLPEYCLTEATLLSGTTLSQHGLQVLSRRPSSHFSLWKSSSQSEVQSQSFGGDCCSDGVEVPAAVLMFTTGGGAGGGARDGHVATEVVAK